MMEKFNIRKKQDSGITAHFETGNCFSQGAIWLDKEGKILAANDAFLRLGNYSPLVTSNLTIFDIDPHVSKFSWQRFWSNFKKRRIFQQKTEWLDKRGQIFPVKVSWRLLVIEQKKICCATIENLFTTNRYQDIWQVGANLKQLAGWELNISRGFLYFTKEAQTLLDITYKEEWKILAFIRWLIIKIGKEQSRNFIKEFQRSSYSKEPFSLSLGSYEIMAQATIIENELVKVSGVIERKRGINKIDSSIIPPTLQFFLDPFSEACMYLNLDGSILYANTKAEELFAFQHKGVSQRKIQDLITEVDWINILTSLAKKGHESVTAFLQHKHGYKFNIEMEMSHLSLEGQEIISVFAKKQQDTFQKERIPLESSRERDDALGFFIGKSPVLMDMIQKIKKIGPSDSTVLITGETGTGKELIARGLHLMSNRANANLIQVNCATLPEHLIEGELFGYEAGAFTGAVKRKKGKFELAHQGTLFLDEIGELPLNLQAKLLRVLQERSFDRLGGTETITKDVRILAATNRDLLEMVRRGTFREDLYFRLNVLQIKSPPLRERTEDIPELVYHFVQKYSAKTGQEFSHISSRLMDQLMTYPFPGNVRELENIVERAVVLTTGNELDFKESFLIGKNQATKPQIFPTLVEVQREHILKAIQKCNGKISGPGGAAQLLGINNKTLFSRMARLGIDRKDLQRSIHKKNKN